MVGDDPKISTNGGNGNGSAPTWGDWVDGDLDDEDPDGNGSSYPEHDYRPTADGGVEILDASLDASVSEDLGSPITDGELQSLHRTPDDLRQRTPVADGGKSKPPSPSTSTSSNRS